MSTILDPFRHEFFVQGMVVAVIAGALCGMLGTYVVLRGMSYIGHGMSHAIFGGAVASFVMNVNFYVGAGVWGFASALMINRVARRRIIGADAAIGVITTASFAFGVALLTRQRGFTRNFDSVLFGQVLGVGMADILIVGAVASVAAVIVFLNYRALLFSTFDPDVAAVSGVPTGRVDALFALMLAATIVATMNVLGVMLIAAALVVPAVVARMLTDSFGRMLGLSIAIGATAGFLGMYLSWHLDIATSSAIVLLEAAAFLVVYVVSGARAARRLRLAVH